MTALVRFGIFASTYDLPTVRSGGHCYEDFFANNPDGVILDLSMLSQTNPPGKGAPYTIGPGTQLWQAYVDLYKRYGVTLPGGTCGAAPWGRATTRETLADDGVAPGFGKSAGLIK